MLNHTHTQLSGPSVFFTVSLKQRGSTLLTDHIEVLRAAVRRTKSEHPFDISAWVTLPDHLHCIWKLPERQSEWVTPWAMIMARFTRSLEQAPRRARPIWSSNIWQHTIRGPHEHKHLVRYCWMNPVKHGLVDRPEDWLYSSWHRDRVGEIAELCGIAIQTDGAGYSPGLYLG